MKNKFVLLSCEHAVDNVPEEYQALFAPFQDLLASHRGIDYGALEIAKHLNQNIPSTLVQAFTTRLLIDYNRSLTNPKCFSVITKNLSSEVKAKIIDKYYAPFREAISVAIKEHVALGEQIIHISIHSFTPIFNDVVRTAEIGLLYDPKRSKEKKFAHLWAEELKKQKPDYRVRMNYPYKGISDGLTTSMRKLYSDEVYLGFEIELNQALTQNPSKLNLLKNIVTKTLSHNLNSQLK